MKIKILFDFHDVFVDSATAWKKAFKQLANCDDIINDYNNKMPKKEICKKYGIDYKKAEEKYRQYLTQIDANVEFAKQLSKYYNLGIVSMARRDRLMKDIEKFNLKKLFKNIYSKEDIENRKIFLKKISNKCDFVVFFNHEYNTIIEEDNLIYIPINLEGKLEQFKDKSFTEHAKNKLLYNELSGYYMQAIANDTTKETDFIEQIYKKYISTTPGKILDCCCGVGRHDYLLAKLGFKVTGIDISKNQINTAYKIHNHSNINYYVMDARNIELQEKQYDLAMCMWTTYNYLSLDKDFVKFIEGNYRHQKSNGILILDSKNIPSLKKRRVYKRNSSINNKMAMELIVNKFIKGNIQNSQYLYFIKENGNKKFLFDDEFVRFYTLEEIKKLTKNYYEVVDVFGDFDMSNYNQNRSTRFIVVLRRI